jgi:hypothetical protein
MMDSLISATRTLTSPPRYPHQGFPVGAQGVATPGYAILAGVASNTLSKVLVAIAIAPRVFWLRVAIASLECLVVGGITLLAGHAPRQGYKAS